MCVCFIGHRTIDRSKELVSALEETVIALIKRGATTFLFGSMSEFDNLAWEVVTALKGEYPFIKRVYVRAEYQSIDTSYEEYLLQSYEETYFPSKVEKAGKYSYVERNYEMIDNANCCVFYYDENYKPIKQNSRCNGQVSVARNSGTKIAYDYAVRKAKKIINLHK